MEPISNLIPTESPHHPKDEIWSFIGIFIVRDKFAVMPVFALIKTCSGIAKYSTNAVSVRRCTAAFMSRKPALRASPTDGNMVRASHPSSLYQYLSVERVSDRQVLIETAALLLRGGYCHCCKMVTAARCPLIIADRCTDNCLLLTSVC